MAARPSSSSTAPATSVWKPPKRPRPYSASERRSSVGITREASLLRRLRRKGVRCLVELVGVQLGGGAHPSLGDDERPPDECERGHDKRGRPSARATRERAAGEGEDAAGAD